MQKIFSRYPVPISKVTAYCTSKIRTRVPKWKSAHFNHHDLGTWKQLQFYFAWNLWCWIQHSKHWFSLPFRWVTCSLSEAHSVSPATLHYHVEYLTSFTIIRRNKFLIRVPGMFQVSRATCYVTIWELTRRENVPGILIKRELLVQKANPPENNIILNTQREI